MLLKVLKGTAVSWFNPAGTWVPHTACSLPLRPGQEPFSHWNKVNNCDGTDDEKGDKKKRGIQPTGAKRCTVPQLPSHWPSTQPFPPKASGHAANGISASAPLSDTFNVVAPHQKDTYGYLGTDGLEHWCCLTSAPCVKCVLTGERASCRIIFKFS